eukprot:s7029_g2.t1
MPALGSQPRKRSSPPWCCVTSIQLLWLGSPRREALLPSSGGVNRNLPGFELIFQAISAAQHARTDVAIDLVGLSTSFVTTSVTLRISVLEWPGQGHARNPKVSIVRSSYDLDVLHYRVSAACAKDSRCWTGSASEVSHVQTAAQHNLGVRRQGVNKFQGSILNRKGLATLRLEGLCIVRMSSGQT